MTAISSTDIWAVGINTNEGVSSFQTLVEHWNGKKWQVVPSPNPNTHDSVLSGVAAVSAGDVWAVGNASDTRGHLQTLIEHYDRRRWSIVPSPGKYYLNGVAAVSSHDVWAVGGDRGVHAVVLRWDGTRWRIVPTPSAGSEFRGVAAISSHDVWVVGDRVLHWNGLRWREVPFPTTGYVPEAALHHQDPRAVVVGLVAVTAFSAHDIWAVGSYDAANCCRAGTGLVVVHWDGRSWRRVPSPNIPGSARYNLAGIELTGISAVSAHDMWAVSRFATEHWDGTRWRIVPSPRGRLSTIVALSAVAAIAPRDAWAVGNVLYETVAAHWNGVRWGIAPTPNTNR